LEADTGEAINIGSELFGVTYLSINLGALSYQLETIARDVTLRNLHRHFAAIV